MTREQIKERLHLRIEQADDRLLRVLLRVTETLFEEFPPAQEAQDDEQIDEEAASASPSWAKPATNQELLAEIEAANAEGERGEVIPIEDVLKDDQW